MLAKTMSDRVVSSSFGTIPLAPAVRPSRIVPPPRPPAAAGARIELAPRAARFAVARTVRVRIGMRLLHGDLVNLSQKGARIVLGETLAAGQILLLNINGAEHPVLAVVRWSRGGAAGLLFCEPLSYDCFAELTGRCAR